jgi:poly-gamma-glutamate synthesis protein (capsule biosynthesis protein)
MAAPTITIALAGDTMLGREVAATISNKPEHLLVSSPLAELTREADAFVLNLECCISERGSPRLDPSRPFRFRAPPEAVNVLRALGVSCVTLANNHALDFGEEALLDTFRHLRDAGIQWVGAGRDVGEARAPAIVTAGALRIAVLGIADHPADDAAASHRPGTAFVDLENGVPPWVKEAIADADADAVLVTPHWGPNMTAEPLPYIRSAARCLVEVGATLVAGHSAHVFHGVRDSVLYDLGDFLDDYATDPFLRNDLGLLFLVTLAPNGPVRLEAVPIKLDYCFTRLADREDATWIINRFRDACAGFGTTVDENGGCLVVSWPQAGDRKAGSSGSRFSLPF